MNALPPEYNRVYPLLVFLVRLQTRAGNSGDEKSLDLLEICHK